MQLMKRSLSSSQQEGNFNAQHSLSSFTKRLRLCPSRLSSLSNVHDRIFAQDRKHALSYNRKVGSGVDVQAHVCGLVASDTWFNGDCISPSQKNCSFPPEAPLVEFPSFASLFDLRMQEKAPFAIHSPAKALKSVSLPSSTPCCRDLIDAKSTGTPNERQVYRRLLDEASVPSRPRSKVSTEELTIVIDDGVEPRHSPALNRCSISPIRKDDEAVQHPSTSHASKPHSLALTRRSSKSMRLVEPDQVDREAQAWLKACERTPYLSSDWLNHLTSSYRDRAEQRAKERELAEAKLRHCEKQLELSHRWRMENLEQRLACLLLTPPVLVDPYLVPQPIPIELPFKPTSRLVPSALPELTESQWSEMEALLRSGPPDAVLVENFRLSVTRKELLTLTSTNWLSDMVINFYMQLLYCRSQNQSDGGKNRLLPRIAVLSTFFYAKLMSAVGGGYTGVRRWSRQLKLLDQDLVLIPIHDRGMHWCLACIDFRIKTITYYDSMGSPNIKCLQSLKDYLEEECKDKKGYPLPDSDTWELVNTEDSVPQQMNGSDCGVFMCTYGEFLSRNARFTFSQSDMPGIRKRMIYEIVNQRLLTTGFQVTGS